MIYEKFRDIARTLDDRGIIKSQGAKIILNHLANSEDRSSARECLSIVCGWARDYEAKEFFSYLLGNPNKIAIKAGLSTEDIREFIKEVYSIRGRPRIS